MKKLLLPIAGLALSFNVQAGLVNGGFETGDLTGWSTGTLTGIGSAAVVTSNTTNYSPGNWFGTPVTTNALEGNYMLSIGAGSADVWQEVSQTVFLGSGWSLEGSAFFDWGDYWVTTNAFPDGMKVEILDSSGASTIALFTDGTDYCLTFCSPGTGQSGAESGWLNWDFTAGAAGNYTLVYGVKNTADGTGPNQTFGYFDDASSVPEPSIIALFGAGLLGLGFAGRRKLRQS